MKKLFIYWFVVLALIGCAQQIDFTEQSKTADAEKPTLKQRKTRAGEIEDTHTYEMIKVGNTNLCLMDDSLYLLADDILLSREQLALLQKAPEAYSKTQKAAVTNEFIKYWPSGIVYYDIANDFIQRNLVREAISHYHEKTGLKFVLRTYQRNYIEFVNIPGDVSFSYIGMINGRQEIKIGELVRSMGTFVHEIGHAVGMEHEHCRQDRDSHINVHLNNLIDQKWTYAFDIRNTTLDIGNFDFSSVMIYYSGAFAIPGTYTITKKYGGYISGNNVLSEGDIYALKVIYKPTITSMYVKLVTTLREEDSYYYSSNTGDVDWCDVYGNHLEFYSDRDFTNRIYTSDAIRQVNIDYCESRDYYGPVDKNTHTLFVAPGTYEYGLGPTMQREATDYGNRIRYYYSDYSNPQIIR